MLKIAFRSVFYFAISTVFTPSIHAQTPLRPGHIALRADAPNLFAPRAWKIEKQSSGDLNRDQKPDAALVLVENKPAKDVSGLVTARRRALLVIVREGKGWRRAGFNASLLLGTRDGGAFFGGMETPVYVSIKRGVLEVNQESGSREISETTHKFRLDKRTGRFGLIGFDARTRDRLSGAGKYVSTNYLTGRQEIEAFLGPDTPGQTQIKRVSRTLRTLESVKGDERYGN